MIRLKLLGIKNNLTMISILIAHLKQKWRLEMAGVTSMIMMVLLGVLLPAIASGFYDQHGTFFGYSIMYMVAAILGIVFIIFTNSDLSLSRITYEISYSKRLYRFMRHCYDRTLKEYDIFLLNNNYGAYRTKNKLYDHEVVSTIFFNIFKMYFKVMDDKSKDSEPFLIDTEEMKALYSDQNFEEFYSRLFFKPTLYESYTPYDTVLVDILDKVLRSLYTKSYFISYYNDRYIVDLVKHILSHWYDSVVNYHNRPLDEHFVL
jgi:hypothetical protein